MNPNWFQGPLSSAVYTRGGLHPSTTIHLSLCVIVSTGVTVPLTGLWASLWKYCTGLGVNPRGADPLPPHTHTTTIYLSMCVIISTGVTAPPDGNP